VGCGKEFTRKELIRVVRSPDGLVSVDAGKGQGRGAYVCVNAACVLAARRKNALRRALGAPVGPEIYDRLEELCADGGV
jgi:predicted RNA-binding protein YlxR (DUF448 family)